MAANSLRAVEVWLFCPKTPGSDDRLVPASGASVGVLYQGTTVTAGATLYDFTDLPVAVSGSGRIQVGDGLQVGTDSSKLVAVGSISADGRTLNLSSSPPTLSLSVGDRLMVVSRVPTIYDDPAGVLPKATNYATVNTIGLARFYCLEPFVDFIATGGGLSSARYAQDLVAGGGPQTGAKLTADQTISTSTLTNVSGLALTVTSGGYYVFRFIVVFQSSLATSGIRATVTCPAATILAATVSAIFAADGAAALWSGAITFSGDIVTTTDVPAANTNYVLEVRGILAPSSSGSLQLQLAAEVGGTTLTVKQGSIGILTEV